MIERAHTRTSGPRERYEMDAEEDRVELSGYIQYLLEATVLLLAKTPHINQMDEVHQCPETFSKNDFREPALHGIGIQAPAHNIQLLHLVTKGSRMIPR